MMDGQDDRRRVRELLEQCSDETALQLLSTESGVEGSLLARFQRLKGVGHVEDPDVSSRLAALKSSTLPPSQTASNILNPTSDAIETEKLAESTSKLVRPEKLNSPAQNNVRGKTCHSAEVEELLESMSEQVRLENLRLPAQRCGDDKTCHSSEEEGSSDSEVNRIVEWAKDAAALEPQQEMEEEPVLSNTTSTMLGKVDPKRKKKTMWKFW